MHYRRTRLLQRVFTGIPQPAGHIGCDKSQFKISFTGRELAFATYHENAAGLGTRAAVYVRNALRLDVNCDRIYGARGTNYDPGLIDEFGDKIFWSEFGSGIYWELGEVYVHCGAIEKISSYGVGGRQPPGNTVTANLWLNADFIENHIYMNGGADAAGHVGTYNWRSWLVAKEILEGISYFDYGRHYLTVQKINLQSVPMSFKGAAQVWMTAQKITNTVAGVGYWRRRATAAVRSFTQT